MSHIYEGDVALPRLAPDPYGRLGTVRVDWVTFSAGTDSGRRFLELTGPGASALFEAMAGPLSRFGPMVLVPGARRALWVLAKRRFGRR